MKGYTINGPAASAEEQTRVYNKFSSAITDVKQLREEHRLMLQKLQWQIRASVCCICVVSSVADVVRWCPTRESSRKQMPVKAASVDVPAVTA